MGLLFMVEVKKGKRKSGIMASVFRGGRGGQRDFINYKKHRKISCSPVRCADFLPALCGWVCLPGCVRLSVCLCLFVCRVGLFLSLLLLM